MQRVGRRMLRLQQQERYEEPHEEAPMTPEPFEDEDVCWDTGADGYFVLEEDDQRPAHEMPTTAGPSRSMTTISSMPPATGTSLPPATGTPMSMIPLLPLCQRHLDP